MITQTVRFFEDKEDGAEEFVTLTADDEWDMADVIDNAWNYNDRLNRFDGVE